MSKRFALLVGMTAYHDDRLVSTATSKEIRSLVERLRDPENGRFDRVVPLLNQTALELQLGIASFFEQDMQPGDLVLFYFAGHSLVHHQNIYLATIDTFTEEYLDATTVEVDFIRRRLNASPAQQVVLLDCDFSRIGATDRHADGFEMLVNAFKSDNRAVLAAPPLAGILTDGLEGAADADQDGTITFAELCTYVQDQREEDEPTAVASNEELDGLAMAFCEAGVPIVPVIPVMSPPVEPKLEEPESAAAPSNLRRYGVGAIILLLLLTAFGLYAINSGLFANDSEVATQPEPSPTSAVAAVVSEASETPSATLTTEAEETAVVTETAGPIETAVITETATARSTNTATAEPTETSEATETSPVEPSSTVTISPTPSETPEPTATEAPTATEEATATISATAGPTSEPVPMDVVAQQAFLRAGPGINYRILAFPGQGTAVTVIARNGDSTWYNVLLEDDISGWLHVDVLAADDEDAFDDISIAATIPVPVDEFFDPILTPSGDSLSVQVYHTYVGTQGDNARFEARLLPETNLVQPTYLSGQELGLGLLIVEFNRIADGEYTSNQVELCMVTDTGTPFYCETVFARKSW